VIIEFDPDWDHPLESVLMTHPEEVVPFMVKDFDLLGDAGSSIIEVRNHHGARFEHVLADAVTTKQLVLQISATHGASAAAFRIRVFEK
jgi:hypothetical protein